MTPKRMTKTKQNACMSCGARLPVGVPAELCPFCLPDELEQEGGRVLGDCEVFEELGRGGMGVVWRGRQRGLNREVAVKTLPGGDLAGADARARFRTEAQAAARLKHPGIVAIYDVGEDDGMPYFVMELVRGRTLGATLSGKPASPRVAARWLRDAALAVQHAHDNGVLHRDIKPSNILIESGADGGTPRVMDFGLAKITDIENSLTLAGSAAGSPAYMSPEQARSGDSTVRSDVYGLGAVLYTALTARAPYQGESLAAVLAQVERDEPIAPRRLNPSIPRDLETICVKCLEKNPASRYPSAQEFAEDLTRFLNSEPVRARPVGTVGKALRFARRRPWQAAAVLLAFAMLAGVIFSLAWKAETEHRHQAALSLITMRAQLGEARAIVRLRSHDSRARAEEIVRSVIAKNPPADIRDEARDVAISALALHSAATEPLGGEGTTTHDWTFALGDLPRERWALANFEGRVAFRKLGSASEQSVLNTAPRKLSLLIAISPGGRWLAIRHFDELCIWDTTPGAAKPLVLAAKPWDSANRFGHMKVAFFPDDSVVLWSDRDSIVATSLPDGAELKRWNATRAQSLAFSPEGDAFAFANSATIELRSWPQGDVLRTFPNRGGRTLHAVAVSKNARLIACGDTAGEVTIWNAREELPPVEVHGHTQSSRGLAFSKDGRYLASSSEDGDVRVWDCTAEELVAALPFDVGIPSFSDDAKQIGIGSANGKLSTLRIRHSPILHAVQKPVWHLFEHIAHLPDSRSILSVAPDGITQFRIPDGAKLAHFSIPNPTGVLVENDGQNIVVAGADGVHRLPINRASPAHQFLGKPRGYWEGLTSSADGRWLAAAEPATMQIALWQPGLAEPQPQLIPKGSPGPSGLALSPDGKTIAATPQYDPGLSIIELPNGNVIRRIPLPPRHAIAWSPDGRYLAANGSTTSVWDTASWAQLPLPFIPASTSPAGACAFAPLDAAGRSAQLAVASGSHRIQLLALPSLKCTATLQPRFDFLVLNLKFSPNIQWLTVASARGRLQFWDLPEMTRRLEELGLGQ
jgi:eukaryotic-like serine/threonine-protein kinase